MEVRDKVVPYDTGKVKIGLLYQAPYFNKNEDADIIQDAILNKGKEKKWSSASNVTTVTLSIAIAFLWVLVLLAASVRY